MPCPIICVIYPSHYVTTLQFSLSIVTQLFFTIHAPYALAAGWTVWGSNSSGGEIFRTCPDQPWGPPSLLHNGYRVLPRGKERPGRDADPSPFLVPWSRKSRAIPLLPLWAVRPVQSLSACTTVHFTLLSFPNKLL